MKSSGLHWVVATGIVGADIGTSVFYGTGILFPIVGYLAPVFVLMVCLMMWLFKRTYEEGLALSPYNGGAYSMILRSLGRRMAVFAGALTVISYLATAAVSSLSGAHYMSTLFSGDWSQGAVVLASFIPLFLFGVLNARGIKEPARLVTVITIVHFSLLLVIGVWGLFYLLFNWSDFNLQKFVHFAGEFKLTFPMLMYGFAAAFLGITGFESAAQIVEELENPPLKTIERLYKAIIILVSLTAPLISFLCLAFLTTEEVNANLDTLLSALSFKLGGKILLTIIVVDATLTLFAATNTAFVGFIGLATTMAKQGNLPQIFIKRLDHMFPSIQGYPFISIPFMLISMTMAAVVAGELGIVAKVYEIAFLGVMVSFCVGVVLMRNRKIRLDAPGEYISKNTFRFLNKSIPIIPAFCGLVLAIACLVIFLNSHEAHLMLLALLSFAVLLMAFYRWGVLEQRLETHSDLRLGFGKFSSYSDLPRTLKTYVLCSGGIGVRGLITKAMEHLVKNHEGAFELVVFHAEEYEDPFFFELLQRVVSLQIAPHYRHKDCIISVRILPGSLSEGLQTLKKHMTVEDVLFGATSDEKQKENLMKLGKELEFKAIII